MADAGQTFFQSNPFDIIGDPGKAETDLLLLLQAFVLHTLPNDAPEYLNSLKRKIVWYEMPTAFLDLTIFLPTNYDWP